MAEAINLSSSTRTNLLALQNTTSLISRTQERLSTGLKVNSAIDDAIAFFQARSLSDRAGDLSVLKGSIDQGISSVETAVNGIEAISAIVEQMKGIALSAKSDANVENRSKAAVQFNDLKLQLDNLANDASYKGTNLLKGSPANLKVTFSEDGSSTLTISGVSSDASGLSIIVRPRTGRPTAISTPPSTIWTALYRRCAQRPRRWVQAPVCLACAWTSPPN